MKKTDLLLIGLLLINCTACQTIEEPLQTSPPPETTAAAEIPPIVTDVKATETQNSTVTPTSVQPSLTPTLALPDPTPAPAIGTVLLIFGDRFIGEIYTTVRPAFEEAGYQVVVASRSLTPLKAKSTELSVEVDLHLEDVQVSDYDTVLFLCDNDLTFGSALPETNRIAQEAIAQGLWVGAICSGPRILAYAQVVEGLTVTGEPSQTCQLLEQAGALCTSNGVERDGRIITARDRFSSLLFVQTILDAMAETSMVSVPAGRIAFYSDRDGNPEIYTINADGSGLARLTDAPAFDDSPAISPDGTQIVFLTARHDPNPQFPNLKYEIYLMGMDGSNLLRLTETDAAEDHPAWSPDGGKIIFDADYDGDGFYEIYTINPDGSGLARLTFGAANDQFADWSPDGSQIAFASDRNGNWDLFVMGADGSNQQPLTTSPDWELFPAWSPDGTQIAFNGLVPRSRNTDIFLIQADGSGLLQLTDSPGFDENPAWSPDGAQIAFQTQRDGHFEIYIMNADGSQPRPLAAHPSDELWPSWGPAISGGMLTFEKSDQTFASIPTWKIGLADLDADGDLDAAFANSRSNDSQVWLNDGSGAFTDSGQKLGKFGHGIAVGDVDGDGDPDIVITTHELMPTRVYLNDGQALFQELEEAFTETTGHSVDLFDIDRDGDLDAVGEGSGIVSIFWNDGSGHFTNSDLAFPEKSIWGDLDCDEDIDLFIKEEGVGYTAYSNDGRGSFTPYWALADPNAMVIGDMGLGDVDSDGDLDVVITNGFQQSTSYPARIFINDGRGQFADSGQQLSIVTSAGVSLDDLDGDGDLDLVLTDHMEPCQIWLNDGNGQFLDSGLRFGGGQFYRHAHIGDLDGDGDLDIFLATFGLNEGPNEIWFNLTR